MSIKEGKEPFQAFKLVHCLIFISFDHVISPLLGKVSDVERGH